MVDAPPNRSSSAAAMLGGKVACGSSFTLRHFAANESHCACRNTGPRDASLKQKVLHCSDCHLFFVHRMRHPLHQPDEVFIFIVCTAPGVHPRRRAPVFSQMRQLMIFRLRLEKRRDAHDKVQCCEADQHYIACSTEVANVVICEPSPCTILDFIISVEAPSNSSDQVKLQILIWRPRCTSSSTVGSDNVEQKPNEMPGVCRF